MNIFTRWLFKVLIGISIIELRKGDVVVFRTQEALSLGDQESLADLMKPVFPENHCVVLAAGTVLEIVRTVDEGKKP